jgi:GntR family transcriptional regulator/MocR family aminotransferase
MVYPEPAGYRPLRNAIASYLSVARGISASAGQIFITAGFDGALALVARLLLGHGEQVWIEDPGYFRARDGLRLAGAVPVPVAVDAHGLRVDDGLRLAPDAALAYVTPSYQAPLGATVSLPRRLALLDWANRSGAWIVEDDYSGEFRYDGWPLPALKSLDTRERVFYVGSFSKTLFPALRLGYLIVPRSQVERFVQACAHIAPHASLIEQMTAADFIAQGHFARHVRRMRKLYAERRGALAQALTAAFGARLRVDPEAGWRARFRHGRSPRVAGRRCCWVSPTSRSRQRRAKRATCVAFWTSRRRPAAVSRPRNRSCTSIRYDFRYPGGSVCSNDLRDPTPSSHFASRP